MDKPLWMWAVFLGLILFMLVLDLGVLNRKDREINTKKSLKMSAGYMAVGLLFGFWVWHDLGLESAELYWTGYIVEQSLSLDNIFVMSLVFSYFSIPRKYQHRVLFWGILGAIVLRGIMIGLGTAIVSRFEWVLYIFAAFLIWTGFKMLFMKGHDDDHDLSKNKAIMFLERHIPVTTELSDGKFLVRKEDIRHPGKKTIYATPLLLALVVIELADLVFAVDSIPAILAITTDPYIVYTSNIFAILGLRSLYFALAAMMARFVYLEKALALVLVFIGGKVFVAEILHLEKIPAVISLGVTVGLIAGGVVYSLYRTRHDKKA